MPSVRVMKNILVLGGSGLIGGAVARCALLSSTSSIHVPTRREFDLANPTNFIERLECYDLAFLCAGINGFKECEKRADSWRVNVDGVLTIALQLIKDDGAFVVYPSTQSVEWGGLSSLPYTRQRAQVEAVLLSTWCAAVVRCGRVTTENAANCAAALYGRGIDRKPGVYQWPS